MSELEISHFDLASRYSSAKRAPPRSSVCGAYTFSYARRLKLWLSFSLWWEELAAPSKQALNLRVGALSNHRCNNLQTKLTEILRSKAGFAYPPNAPSVSKWG